MHLIFLIKIASIISIVDSRLIPRLLLFNDPKYSSVTVSPDGTTVAFLAPNEFGVSNVFTKCDHCKFPTPATFENQRHINGII